MLGGKGFSAAAASSSRARPAPARAASAPLRRRRLRARRARLLFAFEESRARSCATCARSASTWSRWRKRACCRSTPRGPRSGPGAAPGAHVRAGARVQAVVVVVDPISNLAVDADDGGQADADAPDRLPEAKASRRSSPASPPTAAPIAERGRRVLADGHLAAAAQPGADGERTRTLHVLKSRGMRTPTRCASSCSPTMGST